MVSVRGGGGVQCGEREGCGREWCAVWCIKLQTGGIDWSTLFVVRNTTPSPPLPSPCTVGMRPTLASMPVGT